MVNETDTLVVEGLRGLLRANPELSLIEHERGTSEIRAECRKLIIVVLRKPTSDKVTLLSGGIFLLK